mgnify:CR=1 FL=1
MLCKALMQIAGIDKQGSADLLYGQRLLDVLLNKFNGLCNHRVRAGFYRLGGDLRADVKIHPKLADKGAEYGIKMFALHYIPALPFM